MELLERCLAAVRHFPPSTEQDGSPPNVEPTTDLVSNL